VLAAIPYTTFPKIDLGPFSLRTFGVMVALGVLVGAWLAARWTERFGVSVDEMTSLATRMVVAGVIGARITWVLSHLSELDGPLDAVAVWKGGLQFSGGFLAAVAIGLPTFRKWDRITRWRVLDGLAFGLTAGLAFGRVGCYSVGEHFGSATGFFLGTRYEGGSTREGPIAVGTVIHNTSLYELIHLVVLAGILWWLLYRRKASPGTAMGVFALWYGVARLSTDFLRAYDDTVLGLTGAQWMCVGLIPVSLWILFRVRPAVAAEAEVLEEVEVADVEGAEDVDDDHPAADRSSSS
jgi:phosphatidylglycerol---prolipoprotein diacylglyceryl transferase